MLIAGLAQGKGKTKEDKRPGAVRAQQFPFDASGSVGDFFEQQGHAGPIERMKLSYDDKSLFTVGEDGCVIIWEIKDKDARVNRGKDTKEMPPSEELLLTKNFNDEVLDKIGQLNADIKDQKNTSENDFERRKAEKEEQISHLQRQRINDADTEQTKQQILLENKEEEKNKHQENMKDTKARLEKEIQAKEDQNNQTLSAMVTKNKEKENFNRECYKNWDGSLAQEQSEKRMSNDEKKQQLETEMEDIDGKIDEAVAEKKETVKEKEEIFRQNTEDNKTEICE